MRFRFFEPFRPLLTSKFAKSANMIKKKFFCKNAILLSKNAEFYNDFESEKFQKTPAEKVFSEKVTAKLSF
jgi:hypothetical protein